MFLKGTHRNLLSSLDGMRRAFRLDSISSSVSAMSFVDSLDTSKRDENSNSVLDQTVNYFRAEAPFLPRFFPSGYGNPHAILSIRESFHNFKKKKKEALDSNSNPNFGDLHQLQFSAPRLKRTNSSPFSRFSNIPTKDDDNGYFIQHGSFLSPIHDTGTFTYLPHESKKAHFELLIPQSWYEGKQSTTRDNAGLCISDLVEHRPLCVLLPGTGEIGYERRRNGVAVDLAKRGIATLILEGPYYGLRKPKGLTTVLEAMAILQWWKSLTPESPVCVAGVSMGGLHSCMVASLLSPIEIGCVNWLGPIGATPVFTEGCMAKAVDWKAMRRECDERGKIFKGLLYNEDVIEEYDCEAKQMMGLFLQDARISHFEQPVRKDTTYIIRASNDSYVPVSASDGWLHQWPDVLHSKIKGGHVSGTLFHRTEFQNTIVKTLQKLAQ